MAPMKRRCCIPYCSNMDEVSNKQFFKAGSNEQREKWLKVIGKKNNTKSLMLFCCEDHFDLPNDTENYIRHKYTNGTKLKLKKNVSPHANIPSKVCRICLDIIPADSEFVYISEKSSQHVLDILKVCLPEIDLGIASEPVACVNCFNSLESFYNIKLQALKTEVAVVKCVKSVIKKSPDRLIKGCAINLLEHYPELQNILDNENTEEAENSDGGEIKEESENQNVEAKVEQKSEYQLSSTTTAQSATQPVYEYKYAWNGADAVPNQIDYNT